MCPQTTDPTTISMSKNRAAQLPKIRSKNWAGRRLFRRLLDSDSGKLPRAGIKDLYRRFQAALLKQLRIGRKLMYPWTKSNWSQQLAKLVSKTTLLAKTWGRIAHVPKQPSQLQHRIRLSSKILMKNGKTKSTVKSIWLRTNAQTP